MKHLSPGVLATTGADFAKIKSVAMLTQEIAGNIPIDLIHKWNMGAKTKDRQGELLKPYIIYGVAVSSDSAGLSKLSSSRPLLEVVWLIHQPKEIIFARGRAIGGRPIGIWAADNTFMFYPSDTCAPADVIAAIVQAQEENMANNKV